ncbi:SCO1664 family protein [Frigoribacterium faeni]|uniref:Phosphatidylinositol kinase n=1 Tax=Frigoribacterium faeni TaxID=145483 RepID=A0A7W3JFB3_9MICO|nr:SCO1664 family protein [Frigoribacterium faeni]MBA8811794.1 putative repeat protein (TIGR03843 family) [Frigoribacterium faeni]BFF12771.1 SCO1664 family protein [Microbacterium flavescens]GEK83280.1 phosphatidylinositol kinase [Frigoribacterium faeni]
MTTGVDPAGDELELELTARLTTASNATFLGLIGDREVVYKPSRGERPLWDFPDGDLARREVAAYLVSEALGWDVVPRTWLRDGPHGPGMVQLWCDIDPEHPAVDLLPTEDVPETGWLTVLEGSDEDDRPVSLVHEDAPTLRRMAVFDVVVNNADRKGDHVLALADGRRHGVDHGLTFHVEHKLRTVLWGWIGDELTADELADVARLRGELEGPLGATLAEMLSTEAVAATIGRIDRLAAEGRFPAPSGEMSAVPWPLF